MKHTIPIFLILLLLAIPAAAGATNGGYLPLAETAENAPGPAVATAEAAPGPITFDSADLCGSRCNDAYCEDFNPCTINACSEVAGCVFVVAANGTACSGDAGIGTCMNAECVPLPVKENPDERPRPALAPMATLFDSIDRGTGGLGSGLALALGNGAIVALFAVLLFIAVFASAAYSFGRAGGRTYAE